MGERARGLALLMLVAACEGPPARPDQSRSAGLPVAALSLPVQVAVYRAAIGAAFDVGPDLSLLVHPRQLPRGAGPEGGDALPDSLFDALRAAGVVRGRCDPVRDGDQRAPRCEAPRSGYVIRGSEIFQGAGDTLRMHLLSELYATSDGPGQQPFAFEMAYKLAPRDDGRYRVVAEGRVREQ